MATRRTKKPHYTATGMLVMQDAFRTKMVEALYAPSPLDAMNEIAGIPDLVRGVKKHNLTATQMQLADQMARINDERLRFSPATRLMHLLGPEYLKNVSKCDVQKDFRTGEWLVQVTRASDFGKLVVPFTRVEETGMRFSAEQRALLVLFLA